MLLIHLKCVKNRQLAKFFIIFCILTSTKSVFADFEDEESNFSEPKSTLPEADQKNKYKQPPTKPSRQKANPHKSSKSKAPRKKDPGAEENLPVKISSKGAKGFRNSGVLELVKDVQVSQGDFELKSDQATVYFDVETDEVARVIASGNVRSSRVDPETGKKMRATAKKVTFLNQQRLILLEGGAKLWRGKDLLSGKSIKYNLDTGWAEASEVEGVVQPGEGKN